MSKNNDKEEYSIKYSLLKNEKIENTDHVVNFLNFDNNNDGAARAIEKFL